MDAATSEVETRAEHEGVSVEEKEEGVGRILGRVHVLKNFMYNSKKLKYIYIYQNILKKKRIQLSERKRVFVT